MLKVISVILLTLFTVLMLGWLFYELALILHNWLSIIEKGLQTL